MAGTAQLRQRLHQNLETARKNRRILSEAVEILEGALEELDDGGNPTTVMMDTMKALLPLYGEMDESESPVNPMMN